jgi:DNA helicase II / ATP-dependent DNA helicase PcrA
LREIENYRDAAILFRNNSSSIALVDAFDRANIPFYMKDSDNRFFSHWVVQDILNFLRFSFDTTRVDVFERIYSKVNWYLSKRHLTQLFRGQIDQSVFDNLIKYSDLKDYQKRKIQGDKQVFNQLKDQTPLLAIRTIRKELEYEKVLKAMCKRLGFNMEPLTEILNTLEDIASSTVTIVEFGKRINQLETLLKESKFNKNKNAVTLSTFHSSKGLEFPIVYMIDLIDGIIPAQSDIQSLEEDENADLMEEAVRLFYVGMTRAERDLELISYKKRHGKLVRTSMFFNDVNRIVNPPTKNNRKSEKIVIKRKTGADIPKNENAIKDRDELKSGLSIKHRVFGTGKIISLEDDVLEIKFQKSTKSVSVDVCLEMGLLEGV